MDNAKTEEGMGWEVARKLEMEKPRHTGQGQTDQETDPDANDLRLRIYRSFLWPPSGWPAILSNSPSESLRTSSKRKDGSGTNNWMIVWWVIMVCAFFRIHGFGRRHGVTAPP